MVSKPGGGWLSWGQGEGDGERPLEDVLSEAFGAALERHALKQEEMLSAVVQKQGESIEALRTALEEQVATMRTALDNHAQQVLVQAKASEHALREASGGLRDASQAIQETSRVLADNARGLQGACDQVGNVMGQAGSILAPLLDRIDRLSYSLDGHAERLTAQTAAAARLEERLAEMAESLAGLGAEVKQLAPAVRTTLDETAKTLQEVRAGLDAHLGRLAEEVRTEAELVRGGVDSWSRLQMEMSESQAELLTLGNQRVESMNRTLGTLGEALGRLAPLGEAMGQIEQALPQMLKWVRDGVAAQALMAQELERWQGTAADLKQVSGQLRAVVDGHLAGPLVALDGSVKEVIAPLIRLIDLSTDNAEKFEDLSKQVLEMLGSLGPRKS